MINFNNENELKKLKGKKLSSAKMEIIGKAIGFLSKPGATKKIGIAIFAFLIFSIIGIISTIHFLISAL